jgi:fatty acid-binding protein DegV
VVERLAITVVPQIIQLGAQQFREGIDLSAENFYRRLPHFTGTPECHAPSVDEFRTLYASLIRRNEQVLSIHTSSRMNQTVARHGRRPTNFGPRQDRGH